MKKYIGTKIVEASKSTRGEFWDSVNYQEEARMGEEHENGYMVIYPDGYVSWSPTEAFEQAYREMTSMTFGGALEMLRRGKKVARKGWNGKGIFIELQRPDEHSKMTHPYIFIDTTGLQTENPHAPKNRVPWLASQTDMLAEDWEVVE